MVPTRMDNKAVPQGTGIKENSLPFICLCPCPSQL